MNRDELLTRTAMELAEWPKTTRDVPSDLFGMWCFDKGEHPDEGGVYVWATHSPGPDDDTINVHDWIAERERLINKPSWDDAPDKAVALAQNENGKWIWYLGKPRVIGEACWGCREGGIYATDGEIPEGHDWLTTLELRPQEKSAESRLHDDILARDAKSVSAADFLYAGLKHMEDRASTYDKPEGERSMAATVSAFAAITGIQMTEEQGWLFMGVLKDVRSQQGDYRADNYEDRAAYAGLQGEAATRERG